MPTSTSRLSYEDCFIYFDQALADPKGLAMAFEFSGDARQFRLRMNAARKIDREDNARTYADNPEHPLFGRSQYDQLQLKIRQGENATYLIVEKVDKVVVQVIGLSELPEDTVLKPIEVETWIAPKEVFKLEDRRF